MKFFLDLELGLDDRAAAPPGLAVGPVAPRAIPALQRSAPAMFTLFDDQKTVIRAHAKDRAGNDTILGAPVSWGLQQPTGSPVLVLTDNGDGSASLETTGKLGACSVVATSVLVDERGGRHSVSERLDVMVTAHLADTLNLVADPPTSRPTDPDPVEQTPTDRAPTDRAPTDQVGAPTDRPAMAGSPSG